MSEVQKLRSIAFLNGGHAIDHFVLGIYPTVVIGLQAAYQRPYSELIALSTAMFVAFGVFSLPAGWLADRWSRRAMMATFFIGCGVSLAAAAAAPNLAMLGLALFALGVFAAIYHPVGMAILIEVSQAKGRVLAFNGVCGNLGSALAAGITALLASWFGWRAAFIVPALVCVAVGVAYIVLVADDRHETAARKRTAQVELTPRTALGMFVLYIVISLAGGLSFNTTLIALPKIVDEKLGGVDLMAVGGLATAVFLCGAIGQIAMGRLVERLSPHLLFAGIVAMQFVGLLWAANASGLMLILALATAMVGIYGQVTVADVVIARYTADAWRGRIYAVRYFLTFVTSGMAVWAIATLHGRGGFDLVLAALVLVAGILLAAVLGLVVLVSGVEAQQRAVPAE